MTFQKSKSSNSPKPFTSVEQVAQESGLTWRTVRNRLKSAGMLPLDGRTRAEILDAIKPPTGDKPGDSIKDRLVFEQWRKFRIRNDVDEGILIPRAHVAATVHRFGAKFTALLNKKLEQQYPATVAGLDIPAAREYGKKLSDELIAEVQSWASEWEPKESDKAAKDERKGIAL